MPRTGSTTPDEAPACIGSMTEPDVLLFACLCSCLSIVLMSSLIGYGTVADCCSPLFVYSIRRGLRAHESGEIMVCVLLLVEARGARSSPDRALAYQSARCCGW